MKARFNEKKLKEWDKAFEWVYLHIEGARLFQESNPEKSQVLLNEAKQLIKDMLIASFNLNWNSWKEKELEAFRLIQELEE